MNNRGFSLLEAMVVAVLLALLAVIAAPAIAKMRQSASLAVSSNNIRMLAAGGARYLAENQHRFWRWSDHTYTHSEMGRGTQWWFGFETLQSRTGTPEGKREFDAGHGPLAGYIPASLRPDPSFAITGKAFKPKYRSGYLGLAYNVLLGGGWMGTGPRRNFWEIERPAEVVVFVTSAQINTFQAPASSSNPMLEEFYGVDPHNSTVHFRHRGRAMAGFADGSAGFIEMDESTRDNRMPEAHVGRLPLHHLQ